MFEAPVALTILRAILIAVLALAGASKLADLPGSRAAMTGFGVPERLAGPLGLMLPVLELAAAGLLAFQATARIGAAVALGLLLAFSAAIARSMARGEAPDCHCFGQVHSEPAGPRTLARNLLLAGFAAVALLAGGDPGYGLDGLGPAGLVVIPVAVLALVWISRSRGVAAPSPADPQPRGLPVGSPAPSFELDTLEGEVATLQSLRVAGRPLLLVFTDPGCGPCRRLLPRLGEWERLHSGSLTLAMISRGDAEEIRHEAAEHGVTGLLQESERAVSRAYGAPATPSAVLVDADGRIASGVAAGEPAIQELVDGVVGPGPARLGDPLPEVQGLADVGGQPVELSEELGGRERVLLFWNPDCGFCRRMVPQLEALQRDEPEAAESLLLISRGAEDIGVPMLIEPEPGLGPRVGANGTPSAIRVDSEGRIASEVAVGAEEVIALALAADPSLASLMRELATGQVSRRKVLSHLVGAAGATALATGPASLLLPGAAEADCPKHRRCGRHCCPPNSHCRRGKCVCNPGFTKEGAHCVPEQTGSGTTSPQAVCGNGVREGAEQCDGPDLGGQTCVGLGFTGGTLACTSGCAFDTSGCTTTQCTQASDCADMTSNCKTVACVSGTCQYTDYPTIGEACAVGMGACQRTGAKVCNGSGSVVCSATPGSPSPETCNGIDDDCDGNIDNGATCDPTCSAGVQTNFTCSGGGCVAAGTVSCSPYVCNGSTACWDHCTDDTQCDSTHWCSGGVCVSKLAQGQSCTGGSQCTSGACVDGFCCNSACTDSCQGCSFARTGLANGTCGNATAGQPCKGTTGTCNGSDVCV